MKNNSIYIIGGGYSLKDFDFNILKDKTTIAVNKSYSYVPNLDYFITMDFTALAKIREQITKSATKVFIANFTKPYLQEKEGRIVDTRYNLIYKLQDFEIIIKSYRRTGLGVAFNDFRNGDNSGYCALQLAVILGYTKIYLLGIDLNIGKETHFHEGYNQSFFDFKKKLKLYHTLFETGILTLKEKSPHIKIISCSSISELNNIIPYKELI